LVIGTDVSVVTILEYPGARALGAAVVFGTVVVVVAGIVIVREAACARARIAGIIRTWVSVYAGVAEGHAGVQARVAELEGA